MSWLRGLMQRLRVIVRHSQAEAELERELRHHFDLEVERCMRDGASPAEARRRAALRMGNVEALKEQTRDVRGGRLLFDAIGDLRIGWRGLRRNPGFAAAVTLSLSLGVAGTTAIFSVVNAVLLRPLPYPAADRLHLVRVGWNDFTASLSAADFLRLRDACGSLGEVGAYWYNPEGFTMLSGKGPEVVAGSNVTPDLPRVLGVAPTMGRFFSEQPGAREVLISSRLWRERFGSAPDILGQGLALDGNVFTVVGVMPPGYNVPGQNTGDAWVAVPIREPNRRGPFWLRVVVRLRPQVDRTLAAGRLTGALTPVLRDRYRADPGWRYLVLPMKDVVVGDVRPTLLLFFAAVGLVLLVAVANVANLMLARGTARLGELAVRASLGAPRSRLTRQLLTESALLGGMSGALGLATAVMAVRFAALQAGPLLPRIEEVRVDPVAASFAVSIGLVAGLVSGVVPAFWLTRCQFAEALKVSGGGRGASETGNQGRARRLLVATEIALTLAILVPTILLVKTLLRLERENPGFRPEGVLSFRLALPPDPYQDENRLDAFLQGLDMRLRAAPGVTSVAIASSLPPDQGQESNNYTVEGDEPGRPGKGNQGSGVAQWVIATPDYFAALGIPVIRGRGFNVADRVGAPQVAIVSQAFASKHFPRRDALRRRFKGGDWDPQAPWTTIVGVVGDVPYERGVWGGASPAVYLPYAQNRGSRWQFVVARTTVDEHLLISAAHTSVRDLDPFVPLRDLATMSERTRASLSVPRFRTTMFTLLGAVALTLAITGIYGVLAYHITQRRRETAIRRALGAPSAMIVGDVVKAGLSMTAVGTIFGLAGAWALARTLSSFLYRVAPDDPAVFTTAALALVSAALVASVAPALRAVRADPLTILREE
jgi:predicted permease